MQQFKILDLDILEHVGQSSLLLERLSSILAGPFIAGLVFGIIFNMFGDLIGNLAMRPRDSSLAVLTDEGTHSQISNIVTGISGAASLGVFRFLTASYIRPTLLSRYSTALLGFGLPQIIATLIIQDRGIAGSSLPLSAHHWVTLFRRHSRRYLLKFFVVIITRFERIALGIWKAISETTEPIFLMGFTIFCKLG